MATAAADTRNWSEVVENLDQRIARLSPGQIECLALVNQHLSSKEIAVRLAISPHTVDQRIRQALHTLGVERRSEAARIAAASGALQEPYQRLIHQSPHIDVPPADSHNEATVGHQIRHADRAGGIGFAGVNTEQTSARLRSSLPLPFATRSQPRNELSVGQRLLWNGIIAMAATFSAGMYIAGVESLSLKIHS